MYILMYLNKRRILDLYEVHLMALCVNTHLSSRTQEATMEYASRVPMDIMWISCSNSNNMAKVPEETEQVANVVATPCGKH